MPNVKIIGIEIDNVILDVLKTHFGSPKNMIISNLQRLSMCVGNRLSISASESINRNNYINKDKLKGLTECYFD